jgi:hypothetical protein
MGKKKTWEIFKRRTMTRGFNFVDYYVLDTSNDEIRTIHDYEDWGFTKEDAERFIESWHALEAFDINEIKSGKIPKILKEAGLKLAKKGA